MNQPLSGDKRQPHEIHPLYCAGVWQTFLYYTMPPSWEVSLRYHMEEDLGHLSPRFVFTSWTWWFIALSSVHWLSESSRASYDNCTGPRGIQTFLSSGFTLTSLYFLFSFSLSFHFIIYFLILLYLNKIILAPFQNPICPLDKTWKFYLTASIWHPNS